MRFLSLFYSYLGISFCTCLHRYYLNTEIFLQGGASLLAYYKGSFSKAIVQLFPNIGFDNSKFNVFPRKSIFFLFLRHVIFFFVLIFYNTFLRFLIVIPCYSKNVSITLYFIDKYWLEFSNRRKFFENFAKEKGFDSLVPANWYMITTEEVLNAKVTFQSPFLLEPFYFPI